MKKPTYNELENRIKLLEKIQQNLYEKLQTQERIVKQQQQAVDKCKIRIRNNAVNQNDFIEVSR